MCRTKTLALLITLLTLWAHPSLAFCGFYVAKADTGLFNKASKVVIVRDGDRTVITMANDYQGEPKEFAMVVPVPTFLEREQINVGDSAIIDHLDAYSAPRLVEYHDSNPCNMYKYTDRQSMEMAPAASAQPDARVRSLGVTIEASYTVGEYDILILSAEESTGLETWLRENDYRVPEGASDVLASYIRQKMRFFVAKVNLGEQARLGYSNLRPLQVAFESPKFMLPIRLGTVNADGPQELFVFLLTRGGRVETTNYRTVRLPADVEVPVFVKDDFANFYRDMFAHQVERERMRTVFLEYAWDMGWCDPCAADPLSDRQLRQLGVFWIDEKPQRNLKSQARDVFITRLHLRYTADTFPEDLHFQHTGDRGNFQGRYIIRHPWQGSPNACREARSYFAKVEQRESRNAETLASLTGWDVATIRDRMPDRGTVPAGDETPWWKKLWGSPEDGR
ncbi:MAG: DUF2330 domain-containing protein [Acidobacteriota bacterium]